MDTSRIGEELDLIETLLSEFDPGHEKTYFIDDVPDLMATHLEKYKRLKTILQNRIESLSRKVDEGGFEYRADLGSVRKILDMVSALEAWHPGEFTV
jgi:hypothetical protein